MGTANHSDSEICRMDAVTLAGEIRAKNLSPVEVVDAVLERMELLDPTLHAFCTPTQDLARESARMLESRIMAGDDIGPLAGVPLGIKDLVCTQGIPTTSGSNLYKDFVPDEDDVSVERLRKADAIVLGKTNAPEFGYSGVGHNQIFPATRNPWNTDLTSGGSSAGSAAAVATGVGPFAIGSDGGGSIRIPSSLCGCYGMKASMGRVPLYPGCRDERYPGVSSWESTEHIGPISRTVADAALMLSVIAGPDDRDRHSLPQADFDWAKAHEGGIDGCRIAYSADWGYAAVDPRVRDIVGKAVEVFEKDLGCNVVEADPGWPDPFEAFWAIVANDSDLRGMRRMFDEIGDENISPHLVKFIRKEWTAEEFTDAQVMRKTVVNKMWRFMRDYDLLLTPTLAVPAFEIGIQGPEVIDGRQVADTEWLHFTFPINFTGQPAATAPAGWTEDGLPVGLQIIGHHLDDALVLRASAAFEAAAPWRDRWPGLLDEMGL